MVLSSFAVRHDWDMTSDVTNLMRAIEGMADAGRGGAITGGWRWRIGRGTADPVRFDVQLEHADGSHYEARKCLFADFTITAERRQAVRCETTLIAREFDTTDTGLTLAALPSSGRGIGPGDLSYNFDGDTTGGLFSFVVGFQREASAAGFSEEGVASAWAGSLTPDIAGRLVCRASLEAFDDAFRGTMEGSLLLSFNLPGWLVTMNFPNVVVKSPGRSHIDENLYEYALDFAALQVDDEDAAIIELTAV